VSVSEQEQQQPPPRSRRKQTVGDMVRSLAVVLVLVGIVVIFNVAEQPEPVVRDVDYRGALEQARDVASYDVLAPESLPEQWRATSARTGQDGAAVTWHLGLVTARESYAAVEQSDGADRRGFVDDFAAGAERTGTVAIGGRQWRRLEGGEPERRALLTTDGGVTTLVAGGAPWSELEELAALLRGAGS
jgi:hypothetical protein